MFLKICYRDGKLSLVFRVHDLKEHHKFGTRVKAYILNDTFSLEGEHLGQHETSLLLENNGQITLWWPQTIAHVIDKTSPIYGLSSGDLKQRNFEIIVTITGSSRASGQINQARSSYLSREILWGHRFKNIFKHDKHTSSYFTNFEDFDTTEQVNYVYNN